MQYIILQYPLLKYSTLFTLEKNTLARNLFFCTAHLLSHIYRTSCSHTLFQGILLPECCQHKQHHHSTAWSTKMLSACFLPVTKGHNWHIICKLYSLVMGERHVLNVFVPQAVDLQFVWMTIWWCFFFFTSACEEDGAPNHIDSILAAAILVLERDLSGRAKLPLV